MLIPPGYTNVLVKYGVESSGHTSVNQWAWLGVVDSDADCAVIFDLLDTTDVPTALSSDWTIIGVTCEVGQDGGPPIVYEDTGAFVGTQGAASVPQAATVVKKRTNLGGRKGRGRIFFPGVPEDKVSAAGGLESSYVNLVDTVWQDWITAVTTSGDVALNVPVLLHEDATVPSTITNISVSSRVGTQRRRNSAT